ncbi:hypothetical protein BB561_002095 [Smittium simulii]|uniref:Reverse transcriptase domain-containing protein n=1 Tax=Smittium simulii TaxID=133385 RepID=A0A2T9YRQ0_9FUNG|nr:hypothetical protein BB561_002095 [Smittium simulii]
MDLVNELADTIGFTDAEMQHDIHYNDTDPAVLYLQETHLSEKTSLLQLKGYTCVESKKNLTKTGSGLLIAVQNISSWSISELRNEYSWMSVKINSKAASGKKNEIIVINIHTPHLATEKKITKKQIEMYLQNIISKNENKKIILAGDFDMDTKSTINWVNKIGVGLTKMPEFNSRGSRLNGIKMGRMIDHICLVYLNFHFVGASINSENSSESENQRKIDRELITLKSDKIINHNYYAVLSEHIESTSDTNTIVSDTILKSNNILNELKINKPIKNISRPELLKKIIKAIKKRRLAECNITPTWNDITTALKSTPNNKAAGIDTIPSELWKLVQGETEPKSHLAILIYKLINKAWNECNLIGNTNTNVVLPIFKSGNCQDPNNSHANKTHFQTFGHKIKQIRRKIYYFMQGTSCGIGGKLLQVIKGLYHAPRLAVKVNDAVSDAVEYKRGVRQRCPASPVLTIVCDDVAILAESADKLQKSFDILTEWCKRWDMDVNNKKCGIMAIKCLTDTTFKIQN